MGIRESHANLLIVEGQDDKHSVIGLMQHHINWPDSRDKWPVYLEVGNSASEILKSAYLTTQMKGANVRAMGIMLDADDAPTGRYQSIRGTFVKMFPSLPLTMPSAGLVVNNDEEGKRLGVWLMPDNSSEGCLETFLRYLVPNNADFVWRHAVDSVAEALALGSRCREAHLDKANLYTWLAWQDPPGQQPGIALTQKILDPASPYANSFVSWFKELYSL